MKQCKNAFIQFLNKTLPKLPFLWLPCIVVTAVFLGIFRLTSRSVIRTVRNIRSAFSGHRIFAAAMAVTAYPYGLSDSIGVSGGIVSGGETAGGIEGYLSSCPIKYCCSPGNIKAVKADGYSPGGTAGAVFIGDIDIINYCSPGNTGTYKGSLCPDGIIGEYYALAEAYPFPDAVPAMTVL